MSKWEYDTEGVRNLVDARQIKQLIEVGDLTRTSRIRRFGAEDWTTVELQFPQMVRDALPAEKLQPDGEKSAVIPPVAQDRKGILYTIISVFIGYLMVSAIVFAPFRFLADDRRPSYAASENTLGYVCTLLVFVVGAILLASSLISRRLLNTAEIIRAAEIAKLDELAEIRRLLAEK